MSPVAWSPDAHVIVRPAQAFPLLAANARRSGPWTMWRRPLAIAGLLGCVASLMASGVFTLRLIVPAALVWSYVPLFQMLALVVVTWRQRPVVPMARAIDIFFTGYGPWSLFLIGIAATFAFLPPMFDWGRVRVLLAVMALVVMWSAYLDFWFFRSVYGAKPRAAIRDVVLIRLISWTLIFWIFAVPATTPFGVFKELVEAVRELAR